MSGEKKVSVVIQALDETVPGFKSARHHVSEFAGEAKKLLAEAFAGFAIFEFFKTAVEKATEAEQTYVQLSNTLANVGVDYEKNREHIEATIKSLQKVANVRTDEAVKGFNTLVQRSGDYKGSLQNLTLVADLAKAKHLEFNEAAELVGRVMGGNTRVLKQFGIVTKDAADGILQLKERLHGAAEADLRTFGGQVEATKISFLNMAEAVGDVIISNANLQGVLASVRTGFIDLTKWVDENSSALGFWFTVLVAGAKEGIAAIVDVGKAAFHLGEYIGDLAMMVKARLTGDTEGYENWKAIAKDSFESVGDSLKDIVKGHERLSDAIDKAAQKEAEGIKRTDAELDATARKNRQRLNDREALAEEARQKEADRRQREADRIVDEGIARAGKATQLRAFRDRQAREDGIARLNLAEALARAEIAGLDDTNASLNRRIVLEERLAKILEEKKKAGIGERHPLDDIDRKPASFHDALEKETNTEALGQATKLTMELRQQFHGVKLDFTSVPHLSFFDALHVALDKTKLRLNESKTATEELADSLTDVVNGPVSAFGVGISTAMADWVTGSRDAGKAFEQAVARSLGNIAKLEGDHFAALAIADLADFDFRGFALHTAAATALYALSGLAGSVGGRGGAGVGGNADSFGRAQDSLGNQSVGTAMLIFKGSRFTLNADDPVERDAFVATWKKALGNRELTVVVERS